MVCFIWLGGIAVLADLMVTAQCKKIPFFQTKKEIFPHIKPIAIVFPQFHEIPENNRFWGQGFTEWAFLRPMERVVNNIVIRKPHADIGYYNLLDFEHRRYMRVIAEHFGIHGFCFYHFWFKDRPVMFRPAELMLLDGEPNRPFYFTWANEGWGRRWDGNQSDILIDQDYSDHQGNVDHFKYLLKFFRHPNYMKVGERPMFAFYRIEREHVEAIDAIMRLWNALAKDHGLPGIFFMRFLGPFDNSVHLPLIEGHVEFEPGLSWTLQGGGPSIFPDGVFNEQLFLKNNPDIAISGVNATEHYLAEPPSEQLFRISQFKVYGKKRTWRRIVGRSFEEYSNTIRGTFVNWNNSPRRNYTNGEYINYPHMVDPPTVSGFLIHLQSLLPKIQKHEYDHAYLHLAAWNEWNEQSVFEPNDIDGYDALIAIQQSLRVSSNLRILHIGHKGGGTEKYIRDLGILFLQYNHEYPKLDELPDPTEANSSYVLLHIHSVMVGDNALGWKIIDYAKKFKNLGVRVLLTVHDYQWLYPFRPNPTEEFLMENEPPRINVENFMKLCGYLDKLIYPSTFVEGYFRDSIKRIIALRLRHASESDLYQIQRITEVVRHCDMLESHDYVQLPAVTKSTINVAYIGEFKNLKGGTLFLSSSMKVKSDRSGLHMVQYHVFGELAYDDPCSDCEKEIIRSKYPNVIFHGRFRGDKALKYHLKKYEIHIVMYLSLFPETYCYALTAGINTGLALVYLNRGANIDRLDPLKYPKYFRANTTKDVDETLLRALDFVVANHGERGQRCCVRTYQLQPNKWYLSNYPVPAL